MSYIRKVKTASGATAVQIATKQKGKIVRTDHIGSAHTGEELKVLLSIAYRRLQANQMELFSEAPSSLRVGIKRTYSGLLWEALNKEYQKLGFTEIGDEVFESLCLARIVEPTSKIDSLRILADPGVKVPYKNKLYRSLEKAAEQGYREIISQACFEHI